MLSTAILYAALRVNDLNNKSSLLKHFYVFHKFVTESRNNKKKKKKKIDCDKYFQLYGMHEGQFVDDTDEKKNKIKK